MKIKKAYKIGAFACTGWGGSNTAYGRHPQGKSLVNGGKRTVEDQSKYKNGACIIVKISGKGMILTQSNTEGQS